jgi:cytoskeletal protein RodZ
MSIAIIWTFVRTFWAPILVAALIAAGVAWHYNAIRVAKNEVRSELKAEYEAKIKANSEAWIAKIREADDITETKQAAYSAEKLSTELQHKKDLDNAKTYFDAARSGPRLRDPFNSTKGCAVATETQTGASSAGITNPTGAELSTETSNFLRGEAYRADTIVAEANTLKRLLGAAYKACSN